MSANDNVLAGLGGFFEGFKDTLVPFIQTRYKSDLERQAAKERLQQELQSKKDLIQYSVPFEQNQEQFKSGLRQTEDTNRIQTEAKNRQYTSIFDANGQPVKRTQDKVEQFHNPLNIKPGQTVASPENSLQKAYDNMQDTIDYIDEISKDPNLQHGTGFSSYLGKIRGTNAKSFSAKLDTLKSKTALDSLAELKSVSKNGASGLGQVSDAEGKRLESVKGALDIGQNSGQFKSQLQTVRNAYIDSQNRLINAYRKDYGKDPEIKLRKSKELTPFSGGNSGTADDILRENGLLDAR